MAISPLRCWSAGVVGLVVEVDGYAALAHAAHQIALARRERSEVTCPAPVGREVRELLLTLDEIARSSVVIVVRQGFCERGGAAEQTGQCVPLTVAAQLDVQRIGRELVTGYAQRVAELGLYHIDLRVVDAGERTDKQIGSGVTAGELAGGGVLDQVTVRPRLGAVGALAEQALRLGEIQVSGDPGPAGV